MFLKVVFFLPYHTDTFTGRMGKVQTLVKQLVNEDILNQMCSSKKDLAKVLAMDWHPIKGGEVIPLVASCEGNLETFQLDGLLGSNTEFALLIIN